MQHALIEWSFMLEYVDTCGCVDKKTSYELVHNSNAITLKLPLPFANTLHYYTVSITSSCTSLLRVPSDLDP